ncbi:nuclear speckle splicing regulatory protein 1-like protein, partial [Euroglyphus maynei]
ETGDAPPDYHQSSNLKRQTQSKIQKAIELDPTIFQYDEVYDEIKSKQPMEKIVGQMDKKPKYIGNLLKMAETRKLEQEIRLERKIQKEREQEGDEYKDKESFVTSSYREKLEQMRKTHEEMEKQDAIEKLLDVTKHNDLNGFYRSLYKNNMFQDDKNVADDNIQNTDKIVFNKSNLSRNKISIRERDTIKTDGCDDDDGN